MTGEQGEPSRGFIASFGAQMRIPAGGIEINLDTGETKLTKIELRVHFWAHWGLIAAEARSEALAASERVGLRAKDRGAYRGQDPFREELHGAMLAVAASAHALDALYGAWRPMIEVPLATREAWRHNGTRREAIILETLKLGFDLGAFANDWGSDFAWLFDLRDAAVHPLSEWQPPAVHPRQELLVAPEHAVYSLEAADRAVELLFRVLNECYARVRSGNNALAAFVDETRDLANMVKGTLQTGPSSA